MGSCYSDISDRTEALKADHIRQMRTTINNDLLELTDLRITIDQILDRLTNILYVHEINEMNKHMINETPPEYTATVTPPECTAAVTPPECTAAVTPPEYTATVTPPEYQTVIDNRGCTEDESWESTDTITHESRESDDNEFTTVTALGYTVTCMRYLLEENCLFCNKPIPLIRYSICRGKDTVKFKLSSLHYISYHNYLDLQFTGSERTGIRTMTQFLMIEPGKSYHMKKQKRRIWGKLPHYGTIKISDYTLPDIGIKITICINAYVVKTRREYIVSKYAPQCLNSSSSSIIAALRNCDGKTLLEDPIFSIQPILEDGRDNIPYKKYFFGYYLYKFTKNRYKRCEYWPEYLIHSRRVQ